MAQQRRGRGQSLNFGWYAVACRRRLTSAGYVVGDHMGKFHPAEETPWDIFATQKAPMAVRKWQGGWQLRPLQELIDGVPKKERRGP